VTGPGVVHGLAGLANAQQNCWPMILFGGASETYRGGMGAFQEERQVLIASPFCKFAHGIESVQRIPIMSRWQPGTRSMAAPAPPISTCPTTSSPANATSTKSSRSSARPTRRAWWRRWRTSRLR
jgi:Thiamine pyrophosphate-requiring enzymes [acetolactate synthase, pyruvate dehydrogenase (cytochrome), glyoxylate carboligase, phosphonopyruvate decarboxylase]